MATPDAGAPAPTGPILFAYDGSDLAAFAIEHAAAELARGRDAIVLCVWQPADVGFQPINKRHFDADEAAEVRTAAEEAASHGASVAERAGFPARAVAIEAAPIWKGIVEAASEHDASLIVLGAHQRSGVFGHLLGSVAAAVVAHANCSVLVVHAEH